MFAFKINRGFDRQKISRKSIKPQSHTKQSHIGRKFRTATLQTVIDSQQVLESFIRGQHLFYLRTFVPSYELPTESSSSWLVGPLGVPKTEEDSAGRVITRPKDARNPDPRQAPCFGALPGSCRPRPWRYASFFPVFKPTHVRASRVYSSPSSVPSAALTNNPLPSQPAPSWPTAGARQGELHARGAPGGG
jgi:hypothetical protein